MTTTMTVHFDGKVIVPDELVQLPVNEKFQVQVVQAGENGLKAFEESRRRVLALAKNLGCGIGPRTWTREDLYDR